MILVVASSNKELQGVSLKAFRTVSLGVGKVSAALGTYEAIVRYRPDHVVGIGSCGAISPGLAVGDLVVPSSLVQYDVDLRAFRLPRGHVFGAQGERLGVLEVDVLPYWPASGVTRFGNRAVHQNSTLGTADHFSTPADRHLRPWMVDELHIDAVDMESYAIVAAARRAQVPVSIIRAVSDTWEGMRAEALADFLRDTAEDIGQLIARYSEPSEKSPTIL